MNSKDAINFQNKLGVQHSAQLINPSPSRVSVITKNSAVQGKDIQSKEVTKHTIIQLNGQF